MDAGLLKENFEHLAPALREFKSEQEKKTREGHLRVMEKARLVIEHNKARA